MMIGCRSSELKDVTYLVFRRMITSTGLLNSCLSANDTNIYSYKEIPSHLYCADQLQR